MGVLHNRLTGETNEPEGMNWLPPSRSELEEEQRGFRYTWQHGHWRKLDMVWYQHVVLCR